jgi:hypothetical protein
MSTARSKSEDLGLQMMKSSSLPSISVTRSSNTPITPMVAFRKGEPLPQLEEQDETDPCFDGFNVDKLPEANKYVPGTARYTRI